MDWSLRKSLDIPLEDVGDGGLVVLGQPLDQIARTASPQAGNEDI